MESSQIARPHGHGYEQHPEPIGLHSVVEGDQEHHEKKSVLKKVKSKAKKFKDTITKHGHGHDDHHVPDDHDLDEEDDDEDEEMVDEPEVHGAPNYESMAFAHSVPIKDPGDRAELFDPRRDHVSGGKVGNMEQLKDDRQSIGSVDEGGGRTPMNTPQSIPAAPRTTQPPDDPTRVVVHGHDGAPKVNLTRPRGLEEDPEGPTRRSRPPPNYETKVTSPTRSGGNEAKIEPLASAFGEMKIGETRPVENQFTRSHNQFLPEPSSKEGKAVLGGSEGEKPSSPGSYTGKVSFATAAVADNPIAAKNLVASKLGYGTAEGERPPQQEGGGYTNKISSATHAIADKAVSAKNLVASKLGYGSNEVGGGGSGESGDGGAEAAMAATGQDKGVSVRDYLAEKLKPGDEDKALSELISSTLHKGNKDAPRLVVVTESEEVRRHLGETGKDNEGQLSSSGKGVAHMLRGSVRSWFGVDNAGKEEHVGERRLHESSQ